MTGKKYTLKSKELAELFHTTIDTIRYYEKIGLLHPARDPENNYRYFSVHDVATMGIVMELLQFHFPLSEIKKIVTRPTVENTVNLLKKEESALKEQIQQLNSSLATIQTRLAYMNHFLYETPLNTVQLQYFPERKCIKVSDEDIDEDILDIAIAQYNHRVPYTVPTIGASDCYLLDLEKFQEVGEAFVKKVFYYTNDPAYPSNDSIPAGHYLTIAFHAEDQINYDYTYYYLHLLLDYARDHNLRPVSDIYSFFVIDEPESALKEEHIIESQIRVEISPEI